MVRDADDEETLTQHLDDTSETQMLLSRNIERNGRGPTSAQTRTHSAWPIGQVG